VGEGGSQLVDAASVIVLRDGAAGLETFVVVRHAKSSAFPGLLVFPGGQVDAQDADLGLEEHCADLSVAVAAQRLAPLAPPERAFAQYVAGVRELFEEAGVLLAKREGRWLHPADLEVPFADLRAALYGEQTSLLDLCRRFALHLAPGTLEFIAHWITPSGLPRRFDTRFFAVGLPPGQEPEHDALETSSGEWLTPGEALARYRRDEAQLAPPTFMLLSELSGFASVSEALASIAARRVTTVEPKPYPAKTGTGFLYPGDVAYEGGDPERPGPRRRLVVQDGHWHAITRDS
jgi:8-oxo-dGTP pyrophosphatase MutT (NUDIX family)